MPRDPDPHENHPPASNPPSRQDLDENSERTSLTSSANPPNAQRDVLRAWFRSDSCNVRDGLDDYDQDYNTFQLLKDSVTADMRHHIERRKQKQDERHEQDRQKTKPSNIESSVDSDLSGDAPGPVCGPPKPADAEKDLSHDRPETLKLISAGRLAIIGPEDQVIACGRTLGHRLNCVLLAESDEPAGCRQMAVSDGLNLPLVHCQTAEVSGFLGNFSVNITMNSQKRPLIAVAGLDETSIDLVLDLASPPHIRCERRPLGYFAPDGDPGTLNQVIEALPDWVGEFEKPGFISEAPGRCAHRRSRLSGCSRCISSCPADAIHSNGDAIKIDHYLCQGCGLCAVVCPTGALVNSRLPGNKILSQIRNEMKAPRSAAPHGTDVIFHEPETDSALLKQIRSALTGPAIQLTVEDIASIGVDIWLGALAYGTKRVILVPGAQTTAGMRRAIQTQINYTDCILQGMGWAGRYVLLANHLLSTTDPDAVLDTHEKWLSNWPVRTASFSLPHDRRKLMRFAVQHLYDQSPRKQADISLPSGAPFGTIRIDPDACTFCMACAQVCPTSALAGGGDRPRVKMIEARCIQCGLCRRACPENAITLYPRMVYERKTSEAQKILNREDPFNCISCGKPFASARLIERMADRLDGHWMYRSQQKRRRLKMCSACRLQDIFTPPPLEEQIR